MVDKGGTLESFYLVVITCYPIEITEKEREVAREGRESEMVEENQ